ncbi:polyadenylate-binding protein 2-like [Impatiens glandulifera]|uniref:polyadenylate-binding protein 2-like n=1 Tax=Impatiens glandulifera TaxID=253017 RepID=UPI001FB06B80|nr:polyadenylate-binding protein 2-like [Impatiens glandulifera]
MRPIASISPRMPIYPPGGPGLGQQIFYGQPPVMPPQAGFGYQQQLVPGMRPGSPNFFMPMVQPRPGGARPRPVQQPLPMMQQQMMPRGGMSGYRYPPGRGGMVPMRDSVGISHQQQQPIPIQALASALANAPPFDQRTMLGESLYPLVENVERENAAKVTGMLLEMDQTEVLHLLEAPEALHAKVAEAMEVLRNVQQQQATAAATSTVAGSSSPTHQLAALSLD